MQCEYYRKAIQTPSATLTRAKNQTIFLKSPKSPKPQAQNSKSRPKSKTPYSPNFPPFQSTYLITTALHPPHRSFQAPHTTIEASLPSEPPAHAKFQPESQKTDRKTCTFAPDFPRSKITHFLALRCLNDRTASSIKHHHLGGGVPTQTPAKTAAAAGHYRGYGRGRGRVSLWLRYRTH